MPQEALKLRVMWARSENPSSCAMVVRLSGPMKRWWARRILTAMRMPSAVAPSPLQMALQRAQLTAQGLGGLANRQEALGFEQRSQLGRSRALQPQHGGHCPQAPHAQRVPGREIARHLRLQLIEQEQGGCLAELQIQSGLNQRAAGRDALASEGGARLQADLCLDGNLGRLVVVVEGKTTAD